MSFWTSPSFKAIVATTGSQKLSDVQRRQKRDEVYTGLASLLIKDTQCLDILAAVQPDTLTDTSTLPSWVPQMGRGK